jgi:hypothetical protein
MASQEILLIATVGVRDPVTQAGEMGALRVAQEVCPGSVCLLHTEQTRKQAEQTAQLIQQIAGARVQCVQSRVSDPTDIDELLDDCHRTLAELRLPPTSSVHICATSGTPQMATALTLTADACFPGATHWMALDPSRTVGEPLRRFSPDVLRHHRETAEGLSALAACRPYEALRLLQRREEGNPRVVARSKKPIHWGRCAAQVLALVAEYRPDETCKALSQLGGSDTQRAPALGPFVRWFDCFRRSASHEQRRVRWAEELLAAAARERRAGRYASALVALQVAHEVGLAAALISRHGVDPDELGPAAERKVAAALGPEDAVRMIKGGATSAKSRIEGWATRSRVLRALEPDLDSVIGVPEAAGHAAAALAHERNKILHQAAAASASASIAQTLQVGFSYVNALFRALGWFPSDCAPTGPEALRELAQQLADWAGVRLLGESGLP